MPFVRAEIISIGDEITSGVRLDTNSQWLSQRLGEIGIPVAFHSTAGDDLNDIVEVFQTASQRVQVIVTTGGLGPTADDLTRQAIAEMAGVPLVKQDSVLEHIKQMYVRRGRDMPPNNEIQAWFPEGSTIIANPEGTAPGIDFGAINRKQGAYRILALPGVPVEMKQMWEATVEAELRAMFGNGQIIHHHTIHCFGSGESQIETLLPDVIRRGRDPQVGITASAATISLRISTRGATVEDCDQKMRPTRDIIESCLGEMIYGHNGQELHDVVVGLLAQRGKTVAVLDAGLGGSVGQLIASVDSEKQVLIGNETCEVREMGNLGEVAAEIAKQTHADFGLVIGPIDRDPQTIDSGQSFYRVGIADGPQNLQREFRFSGHSGWRDIRAVKEVLNFFRLYLSRPAN
jgi:nicotinamide-nucleotide amidase